MGTPTNVDEKPKINLSHVRTVSQGFGRKEIEGILIAELVRRSKLWGVEIDMTRGERTKATVEWRSQEFAFIEIQEDLAPVVADETEP